MYRVQGVDQKEYGPIPAERVREWIAQGRLNRQSLVSAEAAPGWKPLGEFPEFIADLGGGVAPVPSTPAAAPAPAPFPVGGVPASGPPAGPQPAVTGPRQNVLAIVSVVCGVLSMPFMCCCYGFPFNVAGLICGFISLSQLRSRTDETGRGLALTGVILSAVSLLLSIVFLIAGVAFSSPEIWKNLRR